MTEREQVTVRVGLVETNYYTRRQCFICGGLTEKNGVNARFGIALPDGGTLGGLYACRACIEAGPDAVNARLLKQADSLEAEAASLRDFADTTRWEFPTLDEWDEAERILDAAILKEYKDNVEKSTEQP